MATGDTADFVGRIKAVLPRGWFPATSGASTTSATPVLDALLSGFAAALAWAFSFIAFAGDAVLIGSSTDIWLDLHAQDYFGLNGFPRKTNEPDTSYAPRLESAIFPAANTRAALIAAVEGVTGIAPTLFEPDRPQDTGAYGALVGQPIITAYGDLTNQNGALITTEGNTIAQGYYTIGYGVGGGWGSLALPFQAFLTVKLPVTGGVANVGGYYNSASVYAPGGYGVRALEYVTLDEVGTQITEAEVYAAIERVKPAGSIIWTRFSN